MNNHDTPLFPIILSALVSFVAAFCKELNDLAKNPKESYLLFISETLLSGVCGTLLGVLVMFFTNNIYAITFCSGVGGLMGMMLIKIVVRMGLAYVSAIKNIKLPDDIKFDDEEKTSPNKKEE